MIAGDMTLVDSLGSYQLVRERSRPAYLNCSNDDNRQSKQPSRTRSRRPRSSVSLPRSSLVSCANGTDVVPFAVLPSQK